MVNKRQPDVRKTVSGNFAIARNIKISVFGRRVAWYSIPAGYRTGASNLLILAGMLYQNMEVQGKSMVHGFDVFIDWSMTGYIG